MRDELKQLLANGVTREEIEMLLKAVDEEDARKAEAEAAAKEAKIQTARENAVAAMTDYLLAIDVLSEAEVAQINWNQCMDIFTKLEKQLKQLANIEEQIVAIPFSFTSDEDLDPIKNWLKKFV